MATYPSWSAGQRVTASALAAMTPDFVIKTADESVSSSTTLQDDDDLFTSVVSSATYRGELFVLIGTGDSAADLRFGFTFPTGTFHFFGSGPHATALTTGTSGVTEFFARTTATSGSSVIDVAVSSGQILGVRLVWEFLAAASGTVRLQWCQGVSSATATKILAGSSMTVHRVA